MPKRPSRIDLLELDIDTRLPELWRELHSQTLAEEWPQEKLELIAAYMRAAYGKGYCDALEEPEDLSGALCFEHGYRVPGRRYS